MYRMFVFTPALVFGTFAGIVYFQDSITYMNWVPDDYASAVQTVRPSAVPADEFFITTSDGERIHACWCDHPTASDSLIPQQPVVLFCDGNAGSVEHARWVLDRWTSMIGADVLLIDYRGYGKSTGRPSEEGLYKDARAAYDWLVKEKNVDPQRIIIVGQSLGGGVALHLASDVEHQLLVLESTFTSLPEAANAVFFPTPMGAFCREKFPNLERLRKYTKPVFVSHGDCDSFIPCSHGERLFAAAGGPKRFWVCKGLGHDDCRDENDYRANLRAFLKEHWKLRPRDPGKDGSSSGKFAANSERSSPPRHAVRPSAADSIELPTVR